VAEGPLFQKTLGVANGKILLIGDAAGFFDPITGKGIDFAARPGTFVRKI
jgi:flavin-dependent dehydrogenase